MIPHILIVDADAHAASMTRALVERVAPEAILAIEPTAERGRLRLQQHQLDLLIIDPSQYLVADTQLIQYLKQERPEVFLLALTSASTPMLRRQMEQLGVDAYMEKAASPASLLNTLKIALRRQAHAQSRST